MVTPSITTLYEFGNKNTLLAAFFAPSVVTLPHTMLWHRFVAGNKHCNKKCSQYVVFLKTKLVLFF